MRCEVKMIQLHWFLWKVSSGKLQFRRTHQSENYTYKHGWAVVDEASFPSSCPLSAPSFCQCWWRGCCPHIATPGWPPPSCCQSIPISGASYHCSIICKLQDNVMRGSTVMGEQGVEKGAEDTSLWDCSVCGDAGWSPFAKYEVWVLNDSQLLP